MSKSLTEILVRIDELCDANEEVDIEQLCEGDVRLAEEVRRYLEQNVMGASMLPSAREVVRSSQLKETQDESQKDCSPQGTATPVDLPTMLDRYEIIRMLGQGGFGRVLLARDTQLGREVAIKIPRPDRYPTEQHQTDFLADARKAASLGAHPHIVKVLDVQQRDGLCYIVSEYVKGQSLAEWMKTHHATPECAARIVESIASALNHACLKGLTHRDVKPGNILLDETGKAYLTDFGLAISEEEQLQEEPGVRGTITYMAPEQARGECRHVDGRTDIYSLGVVLYQLLTGRLPYKAINRVQYLHQICEKEPKPIRSVVESIPKELERICLKCLNKKISERYVTAGDLAYDLRQWMEPPGVPLRAQKIVLVVVVLFLGGLALIWRPWESRGPGSTDARKNSTQKTDPPQGLKSRGTLVLSNEGLTMAKNGFELPAWPKSTESESYCRIVPPGRALDVSVNGFGLIQTGTAGKSTTLEISFRQHQWSGNVGIFLGLRPIDDVPGKTRFHTFLLERKNERFHLRLAQHYFSNSVRHHVSRNEENAVPVGKPQVRAILKVRIQNERLQSLSFDDQKVDLQAFTSTGRAWILDCRGGLGVALNYCGARIQYVLVNGDEVVFRKQ